MGSAFFRWVDQGRNIRPAEGLQNEGLRGGSMHYLHQRIYTETMVSLATTRVLT